MLRDHHEFARLLKLNEDTHGAERKVLTKQELAELSAFDEHTVERPPGDPNITFDRFSAFWARVAAAYTPQLVRMQISYPFRYGRKKHLDVLSRRWGLYLSSVVGTHHFSRFVREQPAEAIALEKAILDRLSKISLDDLEEALVITIRAKSTKPVSALVVMPFYHWQQVRDQLRAHLPFPLNTLDHLLPPSKTTRHRLNQVLAVLLKIEHHDLEVASTIDGQLTQFIDTYTGRKVEYAHLYGHKLSTWWVCQVLVNDRDGQLKRKGDVQTRMKECQRRAGPRGMNACGRCGAVRYCSRGHQLQDWPAHKITCIRPRW